MIKKREGRTGLGLRIVFPDVFTVFSGRHRFELLKGADKGGDGTKTGEVGDDTGGQLPPGVFPDHPFGFIHPVTIHETREIHAIFLIDDARNIRPVRTESPADIPDLQVFVEIGFVIQEIVVEFLPDHFPAGMLRVSILPHDR